MIIDNLIKESYKPGNKEALNTYRNIKSELQKVLTAKNAPEYSESLFLQVVAKYCKKLEDSISQFKEAGREDLISEYTTELDIAKKLLPEPVNSSQIYFELGIWMTENGYFTINNSKINPDKNPIFEAESANISLIPKKEMGIAIKYLKSKFPTADGKIISDIVKRFTK